jgi:basic membrane lipoprotein Med (substrate-binding protein (PBP1-ABC) superfamily)
MRRSGKATIAALQAATSNRPKRKTFMHLASSKQVATGLCIALAICVLAIWTNPSASSARSASSVAHSTTAPLKVGLILDDPPNDQGWGTTWINAAHQVQHHFGRRVDLTWQFSIPDPNTGQAINALIQQGYKVIVTTTFGQQQAALQAAAQNPQVTFLATEAISTRPNLSTVDALQTDGYYVAGMAAAATRKGNTNGLVAAFPVPIYLADANAYQLGAASINPAAKTRIVWSNDWSDATKGQSAARALLNSGAGTLATFMSGPGVLAPVAKSQNVPWVGINTDLRKYAPQQSLTSVLADWGPWLVGQVGEVLNHTWKTSSYLLTLQNGGVKLAPWGGAYTAISPANKAKITKKLASLKSGSVHVFAGPISNQAGKVVIPAGKIATDGQLESTSYFVKGIEGSIPK